MIWAEKRRGWSTTMQAIRDGVNRRVTLSGQDDGMQTVTRTTDSDYWLDQMFAAKAARTGRMVRRSQVWVDREVGRPCFVRAVRRRGFHLIRTADQFIVVCHDGPIEVMF